MLLSLPTILLTTSLSLSTLLTPNASAVGVKVAPAYKYVDIYIGQTIEVPVRIYNSATIPLDFSVELADFGALDDHGGPLIKTDDSRSRFGLRQAATVSPSQVTIPAGGSSEVGVTIRDSHDLYSGGHYGAVLFKLISKPGERTVSVQQTLTSLMFVTKKGGDQAHLQMGEFRSQHGMSTLPKTLEVVVKNIGNTQAAPEGTMKLIDPFGHTLDSQQVNPGGGVVLPETARRFVLDTSDVGAAWPGLYQATVSGNFGTSTHTFWLFPVASIVVAVIIIAVLIVAGIWLRRWIHHRRKIGRPVSKTIKEAPHIIRHSSRVVAKKLPIARSVHKRIVKHAKIVTHTSAKAVKKATKKSPIVKQVQKTPKKTVKRKKKS